MIKLVFLLLLLSFFFTNIYKYYLYGNMSFFSYFCGFDSLYVATESRVLLTPRRIMCIKIRV